MNEISPGKRTLFELYSLAGQYPALILPVERTRRPKGTRAAGPGTDIVIEGYPRSGNTFAEIAFRFAQPRPVDVAHHLHMPAQVLWAVRNDVPAIVLIREPVDAVVSLVIRKYGNRAIGLAFRQYQRFYRPLLPVRDRLVVCTFREMVHDYGPVIERVNAKWGTSFLPFEHSSANVERCFELVEQADLEDRSGESVEETMVARPSQIREPLAAELRPRVAEHRGRASAENLFTRFTSVAG